MKMLYDTQTGTLLDATEVFVGDIDPMEHVTIQEQVAVVLLQNRPLYKFENEKDAVTGEPHPEQFLVWICYITDNYGNHLVVKVVSTKKKALEWLSDSPRSIGDEARGNRFVESFVVEEDR